MAAIAALLIFAGMIVSGIGLAVTLNPLLGLMYCVLVIPLCIILMINPEIL